MSARSQAREIALQILFEFDCKDDLRSRQKSEVLETIAMHQDEFGSTLKDTNYAVSLITDVLDRRTTLDEIITKAAPEWPMEKINIIDRNILRLGLAELLFADRNDVPPKVAIDQAIELGKLFGGESSSKFINGVLGAIYKEMGEPMKTSESNKKPMAKEELAGCVVYAHSDGKDYIALVHDIFDYWTLPKGKAKEGEGFEEAAVRAIKTEVNLDIKIVSELGDNQYIANVPEVGKVKKHVKYYLASSAYIPMVLEEGKTGIDKVEWFDIEMLSGLSMYPDMMQIIDKAKDILKNK